MVMLGVPYDVHASAEGVAKQQAGQLADKLRTEGGPANMQNSEAIALIAYLQRLGVDIRAAGGSK